MVTEPIEVCPSCGCPTTCPEGVVERLQEERNRMAEALWNIRMITETID